jgi:xanthine/uracil permease
MSGGNSITYYAPTILGNMGFDSKEELLFTAIYGMMKVASVLFYSIMLTERFGRRPLLLIGATINFICLLYLSCFLGLVPLDKPSAASWVAIVMIYVFAVGKFLFEHHHIEESSRLRIYVQVTGSAGLLSFL